MIKQKNIVLAAGAIAAVLSGPVMAAGYNVILNSDFTEGGNKDLYWSKLNEGAAANFAVDGQGRMCAKVNSRTPEDWHIRLYQTELTIDENVEYSLSFDVWASAASNIVVDINDPTGALYRSLVYREVAVPAGLNGSATRFSESFKPMHDHPTYGGNTALDKAGQLQFTFGKGLVPVGATVCFDNIVLFDPTASAPEADVALPEVEVNQVGYAPLLSKVATYDVGDNSATQQRDWQLLNSSGSLVENGRTLLVNNGNIDRNSGKRIQHIDFSSVTSEGTGYVLRVKEGNTWIKSHPFDISAESMSQLKYDALSYFYHNRQGIEILETVVGEAKWARPVGHADDIQIETFECIDNPQSAECYSLDASKGWYDAGDHGKYVVNGGISAWTMMNQYERSKYLGRNMADFAVNTMSLPVQETNNELPDILDEVKWEMEFLLNMQVPDGKPYAGMAFHRMNNTAWTGIPTDPSTDPGKRYAHAPTTAATLNLAATAAQCARVFAPFDSAFADRCLAASKKALAAAKQYPERFAEYGGESNKVVITDPASGGPTGAGLYNDVEVSDEFFWALAELYATTKEATYKNQLKNSPVYGKFAPGKDGDKVVGSLFNWQVTNLLGAASIVTVGDLEGLDSTIVAQQKSLLKQGADVFVGFANDRGYSVPLDTTATPWGSNSSVMNNMLVLGLVNDLECEQTNKYMDAFADGMTYLLGNNPNSISYVTGYGENSLQNPHHRFWANQADPNTPTPPPGAVSGGPNSTWGTTGNDDIERYLARDCAAEACFTDHIKAWSTNEITINWNSPLAWITAYLDEYNRMGKATAASCAAREVTLGGEGSSDNGGNNGGNNGGGTEPGEFSVALSAPANNASFTLGQTITLKANAVSEDVAVSKVNFKINGNYFAQDASAPYSVTWTPTVAGTYSISARVINADGKGVESVSRTVTVREVVEQAEFSVAVTAPANNASFELGQVIALKADAISTEFAATKVNFKINGSYFKQDATAPYQTSWKPTTAGTYTISARLYNADGKSVESASRTVTITEVDEPETPENNNCSTTINVPWDSRTEVTLKAGTCLKFNKSLAGNTVQFWDSETNSSCNFRGTFASVDGNGSFKVTSDYAAYKSYTGTTLQVQPGYSCNYVKVRAY